MQCHKPARLSRDTRLGGDGSGQVEKQMQDALNFLRGLGFPGHGSARAAAVPAPVRIGLSFDQRLRKMGGISRITASRAVLFRTRPAPRGA